MGLSGMVAHLRTFRGRKVTRQAPSGMVSHLRMLCAVVDAGSRMPPHRVLCTLCRAACARAPESTPSKAAFACPRGRSSPHCQTWIPSPAPLLQPLADARPRLCLYSPSILCLPAVFCIPAMSERTSNALMSKGSSLDRCTAASICAFWITTLLELAHILFSVDRM